ncbi:MAG: hypothetical protein WD512_12755, partial [Candidatus Paceibacterota bacterium]
GWQLAKNAAVQTAGVAIGSAISGFGYMSDLVTNLPNLMTNDELEFDNLFIQAGEKIQKGAENIAPIYQTKVGQKGGINAFSDATWWASRSPSVASSLSIIIPGFVATRAIGALGKALSATKGVQKAGKIAENMSPSVAKIMQSRRTKGIIDHAGNTFLSRHVYNALEADDTFQQEYDESIQKGLSEEESKERAGKAAATVYRLGYGNIWKDALQWKIILGTKFGSEGVKRAFTTNITNSTAKRTYEALSKRFPNGIPKEALRVAGIAGKKGASAIKAIGTIGLGEAVEEINIQYQKNLARDLLDIDNGNIDTEEGWIDLYSKVIPQYIGGFTDFVYDPETIISDEAFDAGFWAFIGGSVMGGGMRGLTKNSQINDIIKQKARFQYLQNQAGALQKALSEGDSFEIEKIRDKTIFSLALSGFSDGETEVQSALAEARLSDLKDSLEQIISASEQELDNSGLPSSSEAREQYEKMYADVSWIEKRFHNNYKSKFGYGDKHDRIIASYITQQEYLQMRADERIQDLTSQKSELEVSINDSVLSDDYKPLLPLKVEFKGWKRAKQQHVKQLSDLKKVDNVDPKRIKEIESYISNIDERISDYSNAIKEIQQSREYNKEQEEILNSIVDEQLELTDVNQSIASYKAHKENLENNLKKLVTKKGKDKIVNRIKKLEKDQRNGEAKARINAATSVSQLQKIRDINSFSKSTKQFYNDRLEVLKTQERTVEKTETPDIEQSHIDNVKENINGQTTREQLDTFLEGIDQQEDLHGNTKNSIKKYAENLFNAIDTNTASVLKDQDIRKVKEDLSKEHKDIVDKALSMKNPNDVSSFLTDKDLSDDVKEIIEDIVRYNYTKKQNKIPKEQKKENKINQEAKDIKEGKKEEETIEIDVTTDAAIEKQIDDAYEVDPEVEAAIEKQLYKDDQTIEEDIETEEVIDQNPAKIEKTVTSLVAKPQYTKRKDGNWGLEFELKEGSLVITNRHPDFKNAEDSIDFFEGSNPVIQVGDTVQLQLIKNDWVNQNSENQSGANHIIGIYHDQIDNPFGIIRKINENTTMYQSELKLRQDIVTALKEGKR